MLGADAPASVAAPVAKVAGTSSVTELDRRVLETKGNPDIRSYHAIRPAPRQLDIS